MRLSESLRRNIMEVTISGILNKFKIRSRRSVLFFEDILVNYIKCCEKHGFSKELESVTRHWATLAFWLLTPNYVKNFGSTLLVEITKKIWKNLGLIKDATVIRRDNILSIKTNNEFITRTIGKNSFMVGFYMGCINAIYKKEAKPIKVLQTKNSCDYEYELGDKLVNLKNLGRKDYYKLNYLLEGGKLTLKSAVKNKIFSLGRDNSLYFRERRILIIENTLFHLIGNENLLFEKTQDISYNFFKQVIEKHSTDNEKLNLLKNLLQIMGWGIVTILSYKNKIIIKVKNPPFGLQLEGDNWNFLANVVLGYLHVLNKGFKIENINNANSTNKNLLLTYSI